MCLHIQDDHLGQPDTKDEDRSVFMDDYVPAWFLDVSKTRIESNIQFSCWKMFIIYFIRQLHGLH